MEVFIKENSIGFKIFEQEIARPHDEGYVETRVDLNTSLLVFALQKSDEQSIMGSFENGKM